MSGDNDHDMDSIESAPDEPCTRRCGGGCGCSCDRCFCQLDLDADNGENRDHYGNQGGSDPIDVPVNPFNNLHIHDASFEEDVIGPNEPPHLPGARFALTRDNVHQHAQSYHEIGGLEDWLRQHWMRVDEHPFPHFVSPSPIVETEMFDFEQDRGFVPNELEGSMHVEGSVAGDSRSVASRSTTCPRSRSSRSTGQVIVGADPVPGFVHRPLPLLLPDTLLTGVAEVTCTNCGGEHEYQGT